MAVTKAATASAVESAQRTTSVNVEMFRVSRYFYNGTLYEKGLVYVFSPEAAKVVLALLDPQGVPVFGLAKPRTKLVQIPQELQTVAIRQVQSGLIDTADNRPVSPMGRLELGDDDPEIAARLEAADARESSEIAVSV